jgi:hypothetical protein
VSFQITALTFSGFLSGGFSGCPSPGHEILRGPGRLSIAVGE